MVDVVAGVGVVQVGVAGEANGRSTAFIQLPAIVVTLAPVGGTEQGRVCDGAVRSKGKGQRPRAKGKGLGLGLGRAPAAFGRQDDLPKDSRQLSAFVKQCQTLFLRSHVFRRTGSQPAH